MLLVFRYVPLLGNSIAFEDYQPSQQVAHLSGEQGIYLCQDLLQKNG